MTEGWKILSNDLQVRTEAIQRHPIRATATSTIYSTSYLKRSSKVLADLHLNMIAVLLMDAAGILDRNLGILRSRLDNYRQMREQKVQTKHVELQNKEYRSKIWAHCKTLTPLTTTKVSEASPALTSAYQTSN